MAVATAPILNVDELNMVDVADLRPHPYNIRKDLGDLTDMVASIRGAFLDWLVENGTMPLRIERACAAVVMLNTDSDMDDNYFEDAAAIHHALWLRERGYTLNPDLQRIWDEDEQLESFAERIAEDPRLAFATGLDDIT